jgi:hypothetical protein
MLILSLRGAERRSNLDPGAHCSTRLLRCARNDSHSIGFDQPDLVSAVTEWVSHNKEALLDFRHHGESWTQPEVNAFIQTLVRV